MEEWINIHTHRPGRGINIVDPCLGNVIIPKEGKVLYSAGIHPMFIDKNAENRLNEIRQLAEKKMIVAIGEVGLDRNVSIPIERQQLFFRNQTVLAEEYGLPVIIHCVRAVSEIITEAKRLGKSQKWIVHGFNNRREVLRELLRHEFCFSIGRQVLNEASHAWQLLPEIPQERLFLETDNSECTIEVVYDKVAQRLGMNIRELQYLIQENYKRVFQYKDISK